MDNLAANHFWSPSHESPFRDRRSRLLSFSLPLFSSSFFLSQSTRASVISGSGRYRCPDGRLINETVGQSAIIYLGEQIGPRNSGVLRFLDIARNTRVAIYGIIVTPIVVHGRGRKRDGDITLRKLLCFLHGARTSIFQPHMHHSLIAVEQPRFHPLLHPLAARVCVTTLFQLLRYLFFSRFFEIIHRFRPTELN